MDIASLLGLAHLLLFFSPVIFFHYECAARTLSNLGQLPLLQWRSHPSACNCLHYWPPVFDFFLWTEWIAWAWKYSWKSVGFVFSLQKNNYFYLLTLDRVFLILSVILKFKWEFWSSSVLFICLLIIQKLIHFNNRSSFGSWFFFVHNI
jgi:hypothetical protein